MKKYTTPEIEIVEFDLEDIATADPSGYRFGDFMEEEPDDYWF